MTHTKTGSSLCTSKAWWQDELLLDKNGDCPSNQPYNLYFAGIFARYLSGEIRNFSYTKKLIE